MIVEAALPLFLAHGEMVTTRQIADAAGIAEGTIFRAFADKDEVIEAVIDAALDTGPLDRALEALPASGTVDADLRAAVVCTACTITSSTSVRLYRRMYNRRRRISTTPPPSCASAHALR